MKKCKKEKRISKFKKKIILIKKFNGLFSKNKK